MASPSSAEHSLDGIVVLDKPRGPTSHDMVDSVRRVLRTRRVGHTGTLDPFATGVLPVCVGQATRMAQFLTESEKTYRAVGRLGFQTSTDDATGEALGERCADSVDTARLADALAALGGPILQVPPAFSAKRKDGVRAYARARAGEVIDLPAVAVTVHRIDLVSREGDSFEFDVVCSAGTYIRALARDVGRALGVGAHLVSLRRTASGGFGEQDAVSPERLVQEGEAALIPLRRLLRDWPSVTVPESLLGWVAHGRILPAEAFPELRDGAERIRLLDGEGELVGLARRTGQAGSGPLPRPVGLHPFVVFAPPARS